MDTRPLLIANWKMNLTEPEVTRYVTRFKSLVPGDPQRAVVLAPAFPSLRTAALLLERTPIEVAAQDLFPGEGGAFTGCVSAAMLAAVGCRHVLVGHSERRRIGNEDDELVRRKARAALEGGLAPVICVGETADERRAGDTDAVVERQVRRALEGLLPGEDSPLAIAYEPVWAIGTGDTATPEDAERVHRHIRGVLEEIVPGAAGSIRILYGGSVTPDNAAQLMARPAIGGLLVGGASLEPESFAAICAATPDTPAAGSGA